MKQRTIMITKLTSESDILAALKAVDIKNTNVCWHIRYSAPCVDILCSKKKWSRIVLLLDLGKAWY